MYRHANKSCLNCGGDASVPETCCASAGQVEEISCDSCGRILMRVFTVHNNAPVPLHPAMCDRLERAGIVDDTFRIGLNTDLASAEVWFSDHDVEVFMNGSPIRRSLPDAFYDFRDAVLKRHDIYG